MIAPKRRLTNHALHGREEWFKRIFRDQIAEAAGILEVVLSGIVLAALLMSIVPLVELMPGLLTDADSLEIRTFLERALDIVIGIEFIKMLAKHSPGSVLEVLLYAIARHMIVGHEDAVQNLVSVGAIALIFVIRITSLCRPSAIRCRAAVQPPILNNRKNSRQSVPARHKAAHSPAIS